MPPTRPDLYVKVKAFKDLMRCKIQSLEIQSRGYDEDVIMKRTYEILFFHTHVFPYRYACQYSVANLFE